MKLSTQTQQLIDLCNQKLNQKPLLYISRDLERGLGLNGIFSKYFHCSTKKSIFDNVIKNNLNLHIKTEFNNTSEFLKSEVFEAIYQAFDQNLQVKFFQQSKEEQDFLKSKSIKFFNNDYNISKKFEDKISFGKIAKQNNIPVPDFLILDNSNTVESNQMFVEKFFGKNKKLSFQAKMSHTGKKTFFGTSKEFVNQKFDDYNEQIKVSTFIDGFPLTINAVINFDNVFVGAPQLQITGIKGISPSESATIGNDFGVANQLLHSTQLQNQLFVLIQKIGHLMRQDGFVGLFGVDLILAANQFFVIEVNARQTANISFESQLELMQGLTPIELIDLASWLGIKVETTQTQLYFLQGAQLILRAEDNITKIRTAVKNGIYRIRSDRITFEYSTREFNYNKEIDSFFIDEERDIPINFEKSGWFPKDICHQMTNLKNDKQIFNTGLLLLCQPKDYLINAFEEVSRLQSLSSLVEIKNSSYSLKPWAYGLMQTLKETLI